MSDPFRVDYNYRAPRTTVLEPSEYIVRARSALTTRDYYLPPEQISPGDYWYKQAVRYEELAEKDRKKIITPYEALAAGIEASVSSGKSGEAVQENIVTEQPNPKKIGKSMFFGVLSGIGDILESFVNPGIVPVSIISVVKNPKALKDMLSTVSGTSRIGTVLLGGSLLGKIISGRGVTTAEKTFTVIARRPVETDTYIGVGGRVYSPKIRPYSSEEIMLNRVLGQYISTKGKTSTSKPIVEEVRTPENIEKVVSSEKQKSTVSKPVSSGKQQLLLKQKTKQTNKTVSVLTRQRQSQDVYTSDVSRPIDIFLMKKTLYERNPLYNTAYILSGNIRYALTEKPTITSFIQEKPKTKIIPRPEPLLDFKQGGQQERKLGFESGDILRGTGKWKEPIPLDRTGIIDKGRTRIITRPVPEPRMDFKQLGRPISRLIPPVVEPITRQPTITKGISRVEEILEQKQSRQTIFKRTPSFKLVSSQKKTGVVKLSSNPLVIKQKITTSLLGKPKYKKSKGRRKIGVEIVSRRSGVRQRKKGRKGYWERVWEVGDIW